MPTALAQGAALIVVSELLLATMGAVIKAASQSLPNEMLVWCRNLFGLAALLPFVLRRGAPSLATRCLHLHLLRGVAGVSAMYCFFYTISAIPLAEAVLLKLTAPFLLPVIALAWLGERVPASTGLALLVGFAGVVLVLRPGGGVQVAALAGLAGAFLAALAKVAIRRMKGEPGPRIVFYFGVIATAVSTVPLLWAWQTPTPVQLGWLAAMGGCATAAQLCLTQAYRLAPPGRIGPFTYVAVVFGSAYGWLFWGEVPGPATVAGSLLIVAAGVLALREGRATPQAAAPRRPADSGSA